MDGGIIDDCMEERWMDGGMCDGWRDDGWMYDGGMDDGWKELYLDVVLQHLDVGLLDHLTQLLQRHALRHHI